MYGRIGAPFCTALWNPAYSSQLSAGSLHVAPFVPHQCCGPAIRTVGTPPMPAALGLAWPLDAADAPAAKTPAAATTAANVRVPLISPSLLERSKPAATIRLPSGEGLTSTPRWRLEAPPRP